MFGITQEMIYAFGTKLLMVAGGYAGGYLFTMLAGAGFDKMLVKRETPAGIHRLARKIGGILGAVLIAILVFRGALGFGNGGGAEGPGQGNAVNTLPTGQPTYLTPPAIPTQPKKKPTTLLVEPVKVLILAGDHVEKGTQNYYRIDDSPVAVDRTAVLAAVEAKQKASQKPVIVIYSFGPDAGTKTIAFTDLDADLKQLQYQFLSTEGFQKLLDSLP